MHSFSFHTPRFLPLFQNSGGLPAIGQGYSTPSPFGNAGGMFGFNPFQQAMPFAALFQPFQPFQQAMPFQPFGYQSPMQASPWPFQQQQAPPRFQPVLSMPQWSPQAPNPWANGFGQSNFSPSYTAPIYHPPTSFPNFSSFAPLLPSLPMVPATPVEAPATTNDAGVSDVASSTPSTPITTTPATPTTPATSRYPLKEGGYRNEGTASWYGPGFDGNLTANGEVFDQEAMTVAHNNPALMGKYILITRVDTGKQVVAKVNDTGGFNDLLPGFDAVNNKPREVDVSHGVAKVLGFVDDGLAQVRIEQMADDYRPA